MRKTRRPLPPEFAAQVRDAVSRARTGGADVAEALNYKDLLWTPAAQLAAKVEVLKALKERLEEHQPHEMMRRKNHQGTQGTPADMYEAVKGYLDAFIEHVKKGEQ